MTQPGNIEQRAYGIRRSVPLSYEEALSRIREALKTQGFGVLTEIDVKATMKAKLDVDLDPYMILGACNPPLALRALTVEPEVGMLLPCNVVVRVQQGETIIEAMDPEAAMGLVRTPAIREVATQAKQRLVAALASVANA